MSNALKAAACAAIMLAAPVAASAQTAFTTNDVNMRAGPGVEYPRVATIPEDASVDIYGCLRGFNWCDVGWDGDRGWVNANFLSYSYGGRYVAVDQWGPRIGLPLIGFEVRDYWGRYYRDRPWWEQRTRYFDVERRDDWRRDRDDWRREDWRRDRDDWRREDRRQEPGMRMESPRDRTPDRSQQRTEDPRQQEQRTLPPGRQERMQERMDAPQDRARDRTPERERTRDQDRRTPQGQRD